ncbi:uncharacterized protein LOC128867908 [Anastrepha ludens]|uniref:uncharacterized protein LOC128867908 n=1 Tax=Anastrepha ludens TaxID=28586 RepID=UPI0023AEC9D5|nr:uncharacterized protein LOC128867908 [Anastrepha ludens]
MFGNNNTNHMRPVLYYDDINPHSRAVLMILNMLDVDIELRAIEMIRGEHMMPAYGKINPAHTVPTMVHNDLVITDNAIFSYVCQNHDNEKAKELIAFSCSKGHCHVLSRLFFESQVLHRIHGQLMTDLVRKTIYETDVDYHRKKVEQAYDVMERYLTDGPYMAGCMLTAADISFVACLGALDIVFPIDADRNRWAKLNDWFGRMRALSVQKININGIEKQRQIVEYFAKYQFTSGLRHFTTGVRESLSPQFPLRHLRCNIGVQTTEPVDEDTLEADLVVMKSAGGNTTTNDVLLKGIPYYTGFLIETNSPPDVAVESIESDTPQDAPLQASATLPKAQLVDNYFVSQSIANTPLQVEKSSDLAYKEKPPVPPKKKRDMAILMTSIESVNPQDADNMIIDQSCACEEPERVYEEKLKNSNSKDKCGVISKTSNLSRLDGGIDPTVASEMPPENEIPVPPVKAYLPIPVNNSAEISKDPRTTPAKSTTAPDSLKTSTESQAQPSKIPLLPPRLLINCPQVALQYARSSNAPAVAVTAPPPSPENSSQDEQIDFEFPQPPSEVLIQHPCTRGKVARAPKLADTNKVSAVGKPLIGVQSALGNSKSTKESVARIIEKKPSMLKSPKARKVVGSEPKEPKLVRKTNKGLLLASGTRSTCSNFSQSSLQKDKAKKVQKPLNESNPMQKLIPAMANSSPTKAQAMKKRKLERCSGVKIVESLASTKDAVQKASGRWLTCSATKVINAKGAEKKRKAEGGGQWISEEKEPSTAKVVDTKTKFLDAKSKESTGADVKSKTVTESKVNHTIEAASAKHLRLSTSTAENTSLKILVKTVKKDVKPANLRLITKNKSKIYPTKFLALNQTSSHKNQSKMELGKRAVAKNKNKCGSRATSEEILSSAQPPLLETTCASSVPELECVEEQSTLEQNRETDTSMLINVTPATAAEKTLSSPPVSTDSSILPAIIETVNTYETAIMARTSSSKHVNSFTVKEAPVTVELAAKAPPTLTVNNIIQISPPQPPPLPPPPVPFHYKQKQPTAPPNISTNDALPQAGTVAKVLQSLSTVGTEEVNSICSTTKSVKNAGLKMKNVGEATIPKMKNAAHKENITRNIEETVVARPLAEILTAIAQLKNRKMVERTNPTELINETQQSFTKTKDLSDKRGNMAQAAGEQAKATITKETIDTVELDCKATAVAALDEFNKPAGEKLVRLEEDKKLAEIETEHISRADTQSPLIEVEPTEVLDVRAESIPVLEPAKRVPNSFISETHVLKKSPMFDACPTNTTTNLSESAPKSTQAAHNSPAKSTQINRNITQRNLVSGGSVTLPPTPLPTQPNIISTGYARAETYTVAPLFARTGHALGNIIAPNLRRHSTGPCSHGPSGNVPMPPEQLIPVERKCFVPPPPPMPRPLFQSSTKMAATTHKSRPHLKSGFVMSVRVLSPRIREDRPYPTTHGSRSQRGDERKSKAGDELCD